MCDKKAPCDQKKEGCRKSKPWPCCMYDIQTCVIGIPYNYGQPKLGVSNGPSRMREYGVIKSIEEMGFKVSDAGDMKFEDVPDDSPYANVKRPRAVGRANKLIAQQVASALEQGGVCLTLGGDHSLAIGSIIGQSRVQLDFGVIWIDAHADINPPQASYSGNAHGMPLAFLVKELQDLIPADIPEFDWIKPCIGAKDIAYIGLRDLDPAEKKIIDDYNITAFTMHDVIELGLSKVVQLAIAAVSNNNSRPLHLSFDIDALDPTFAPSTGTPVPGGLTLREGVYITEQVAATGLLTVMDVVEVNPELGSAVDQQTTLQSALEVIGGWFGRRSRKQLTPGYTIPRP